MASKTYELEGIGPVVVIKRSTNRNIKLSIKADGKIVVTIPAWSPFAGGLAFARAKQDWIRQQLPVKPVLQDGQPIGKFHHVALIPTAGIKAVRTLVSKTTVIVRYPVVLLPTDHSVQAAAATACIRALRTQAQTLLPSRLEQLALQHGFEYKDVQIKLMTSRWGSCDQQQHIVLNLFLMQLPWECIDYVLLHELTHTTILRHGPPFWEAMGRLIPDLAAVRKQMRGYQPILH